MKALLFILLVPIFVFCNFTKDEIIQDFSRALLEADVEGAAHAWETYFPEDIDGVEVCRAFLLLSEGNTEEARELFEANYFKIKDQIGSLSSQEQVRAMFYYCLSYVEENSLDAVPKKLRCPELEEIPIEIALDDQKMRVFI